MSPPSYNFVIIGQPLTNPDLSPLLLCFIYCHPFYVHQLWIITYMYITTHPLCPYLMLSSLKPLLSSYPLMVSVSRICKRFYPNIPLISLIHMTNSCLQPYVWMAALCCTTSQQSPKSGLSCCNLPQN